MRPILRILALLPLIALLSLSPAPRAASQAVERPLRVYLPVALRPFAAFTASRIGPSYGRVLGVRQDPFNPSVVYAMTYGSGMYKSINSGGSWAPISNGISYLTLQSMAVDPNNRNILYAGTYGDSAYPYNGVFKSTDGGASWARTGDMVNYWNGGAYRNPVVYALAVDPQNSNRIYAGTRMKGLPDGSLGGGGVFRSENGGASWEPVNRGLPNEDLYVYDLAVDPSRPGLLYAALHEHGLYRSRDYGSNWEALGSYWGSGVNRPWSGRAITIDPFNPDTLYFGAMKNQGAYRSYDRGETWKRVGDLWWDVAVGAISPDPYNKNRLFVGVLDEYSNYFKRSTDGATSWSTVGYLNTWGPVAFAPDGASAYIGSDGDGVYKTTNGGQSWFRASNGLTGYSVTGLMVNAANPKVMVATLYGLGVYVTKDGGANWEVANSGLTTTNLTSLTVDPRNPAVLYATTTDSGVFVSRNSAGTWGALSGGFPSTASLELPRDLEAFENRPLPERDDLLENPDLPLPQPANLLAGLAQGNAVAVSPFDSSVLTATNRRGIYRLESSGWAPTSQTSGTAYAILFDRAKSGRVLAGVDGGTGSILISADNGRTWARSNAGIAGRTVYTIFQHPTTAGLILAGTDSGVYYSSDGGANWAASGLEGQAVKALGCFPKGVFYAGTAAGGYFAYGPGQQWASLPPTLNSTGVQGIIPGPGGNPQYFITRLAGIVLVTAE